MKKFVWTIRCIGVLLCLSGYYIVITKGKYPVLNSIEVEEWFKWLLPLTILAIAEAVINVTRNTLRKIKEQESVEICPRCETAFRAKAYTECPKCKVKVVDIKQFYKNNKS